MVVDRSRAMSLTKASSNTCKVGLMMEITEPIMVSGLIMMVG